MVDIIKPIVRTRVSNAEFLTKVRELIADGNERFICNAIERVGHKFGTPTQIANLALKVRQEIYPYAYYTQWASATQTFGFMSIPGWQLRGRLELIDRFIAEAQHE